MRIALIAPLAEPVPPKRYGGTERVVSWLAEELVRRGHDVTLFAAGTSRTSATLVPVVERPVRRGSADYDLLAWHCLQAGLAQSRAGEFDIMHLHLDALGLAACRGTVTPVLTTMHGRLDLPARPSCWRTTMTIRWCRSAGRSASRRVGRGGRPTSITACLWNGRDPVTAGTAPSSDECRPRSGRTPPSRRPCGPA